MFPEVAMGSANNSIKATLDSQLAQQNVAKRNIETEKMKDKERIDAQMQKQEIEGKEIQEKKLQQQALYRDYLASQSKQKEESEKNFDKLDPEVVKMNRKDLEVIKFTLKTI